MTFRIPFDFDVLYQIGQAVLAGLSPYSVAESFYPPAMSYLFAILALLPEQASFLVWTALNAYLLVKLTGRRAIAWLFYVPILFGFGAGQVDLAFVALLLMLRQERGWRPALAAALLTLKPQLAIVLLPWFVIRWSRQTALRAAALALVLHSFPLLIRPDIYLEWIGTLGNIAGRKFGGIGVWSLTGLPSLLLLILTGGLVWLALRSQNERRARALLTLANPMFAYYDATILLDAAPWWMLVPASLLTLVASYQGSNALFILLPLASLAGSFWPRSAAIESVQATT